MKGAVHTPIFFLALILTPLLLAACGGGGAAPDQSQTVNISGTITYTGYPLRTSGGINYNAPQEKPVRGAVIEIHKTDGSVISRGNTNAAGGYDLTAPSNTPIRVVVKAALGDPENPNTRIVDNTNGYALYALFNELTTGSGNTSRSFNAPSGWGGNGYTSTRSAAPFAILDTIYRGQQLVLSADSQASFPALTVNWSKNNRPAYGNIEQGDISTTYYSAGKIYILGAENTDTDEYDQHVVAHEWGHYFENRFSRSDNIGGGRSGSALLDPVVAFSEGFGNALSGMIMSNPNYIDTVGMWQSVSGLHMDLDADATSDTATEPNGLLYDGYYSETSVQEVLYDLYDSGPGDDDATGLGFQALYETLTNEQKNSYAFTTIFGFLYYLKQNNPAQDSAITALAAAENINSGNEYDAPGQRFYTTATMDGLPVTQDLNGKALRTDDIYGKIGDYSAGNKLYNRLFFKTTAPATGCHTLNVTPFATGDPIIYAPDVGYVDQRFSGGTERLSRHFTLGEKWSFAIGSFVSTTGFQLSISATPNACQS